MARGAQVYGDAGAGMSGGGGGGVPASRTSGAAGGVGPRTLDEVLEQKALTALYQPLVELDTRAVVGYEALARGPAGSVLEYPDVLFRAAKEAGRVAELEWACQAAAVRGALGANLGAMLTLFLCVEPSVIGTPIPPDVELLLRSAEQKLRVMLQITERAVTENPAALIAAVETARKQWWGVALDVGRNPKSLALMPFVNPDVIKLDLRIIQDRPREETARTVTAVMAQSERTGAAILAEGIETEAHLHSALGMGATFGQGWLFGRPGELPRKLPAPRSGIRLLRAAETLVRETPFETVRESRPTRVGRKGLLVQMSRHLEDQALALGDQPVVLSSFQEAAAFTPRTQQRYVRLAQRCAFVAAIGPGLAAVPTTGVRGARVEPWDALREEWNVIVLSPQFAGALVARDLGDRGLDGDRRYHFAITYNRDLVLAAARSLLHRVAPL